MNAVMAIYRSSIGKKVAVAVTGMVLFGFVVVHMTGNLLVFAGPETYNAYAESLQANQGLVWAVRLVLLSAVTVHIATIVQLTQMNRSARPVAYAKGLKPRATSFAALSMRLSGLGLLLFIIYHLLHFTVGAAHPDFVRGDVYHNMVVGFQNPLVAGIYILAMLALAPHLYHGGWSMLQTLGFNHPRYNDARKKFAATFAGLILVGNCSMPVAVLAGLIG